MKTFKWIMGVAIVAVFAMLPLAANADNSTNAPARPYPLKTCLVCDMELGDMGKPYVFAYKGQEIKVCDKSEKADFDKDPAKYMKKLAEEKAKLKK